MKKVVHVMRSNSINNQKGRQRSIIQSLRIHGSTSRVILTELTGLSRATISIAISELVDANLIREADKQPSTGGRPVTMLELVPYSACIVGAELDNHEWTLGAFDLLGNEIASSKIPVNMYSINETFDTLTRQLKLFIQKLDKKPIRLLGVGIPGSVDKAHRKIITAAEPGFNWCDLPVSDWLEKEIGWETFLINRHRARGLSECRFGAGQQFNNMIYIGAGSGINAGLYIDRHLLSGSILGAAEFGHTTIIPDGPLCSCGNNGCLQLFASTSYIEQETRKLMRAGETSLVVSDSRYDLQLLRAQDICRAAEKGDATAAKVVNQAATHMGIAMANMVNLIQPEGIVLGGSLPRMSNLYVNTANKVMRQRAMSILSSATDVKKAVLNETGGALGAANFALDNNLSMSHFS
jgi:predicted NBD/HSP70 family sugar kinase